MSLMVERFQSSGQLQKPFISINIPLPVMSGAMGVCSMRFGVLDISHLNRPKMLKYYYYSS